MAGKRVWHSNWRCGEKDRGGDARALSKYFPPYSVDVTEPFLGPPLKIRPHRRKAEKIIQAITSLYRAALVKMMKVLKNGGTAVIISPHSAQNGIL